LVRWSGRGCDIGGYRRSSALAATMAVDRALVRGIKKGVGTVGMPGL
jgi:hypothetical protein